MKKIYYIFTSCVAVIFAIELFLVFTNPYLWVSNTSLGRWLYLITPGYAFTQGLNNDMFVSAQGYFFGLAGDVAFNLLDMFNLGINKIPIVMSLFFSSIIVFLWGLIRIFTKYKIPFLVVLLLAIFSPWGLNFSMVMIPEVHNPTIWSVFLMQIIFSVIIAKDKNLAQSSNKEIFAIAIIQALFLTTVFNYKMNFFIGAAMLCLIFLPYLKIKQIVWYVIFLSISFIIVNALISLISGYDYYFYFSHLFSYAKGRNFNNSSGNITTISILIRTFFVGVAFFIILWGMIVANKLLNNPPPQKQKTFLFYLKQFLPSSKQDYQKIFVIFILVSAIYVIGIYNGDMRGRYNLLLIPIVFFTYCKAKFKKLLFLILALLWVCFFGIYWAKTFIGINNNTVKITIPNINPKHQLKFAIDKNEFNNLHGYGSLVFENFDDLVEIYKKFAFTENTKVFICDAIDYSPFVLGSKISTPEFHDLFNGNSIDYIISQLKVPQDADIVTVIKSNEFMLHSTIAYAFKDLVESDKNYTKFYETRDLSFYAKKDWLKKKGIAF
jgi:hypothetical protein